MKEFDAISEILQYPDLHPVAPLSEDELKDKGIDSEELETSLGKKMKDALLTDVSSIMYQLMVVHSFCRDMSRSRRPFWAALKESAKAHEDHLSFIQTNINNGVMKND